MDTTAIITQAAGALATGGASFLGAFFRFKQRLKDTTAALKEVALELPALRSAVTDAKNHYEAMARGWHLEFSQLRQDFETEAKHRREIAQALEQDRASRPDPLEDIARDLDRLRQDVERLKDRGGRYVRSDAFAAFTKAQEDQWKEMARTLGRLEGMLKS